MRKNYAYIAGATMAVAIAPLARATITSDTSALSAFLTPALATGGGTIGSYTYDAATDTAYVVTFGAAASLREIDTVSTTPTAVVNVSNAQWQLFTRAGNPAYTGQAIPSGILLNPQPITLSNGTVIPVGGEAIIIDAGLDPSSGSGTSKVSYTNLGQRLYGYDLQAVTPNPNPTVIPTSPPYYDGRDVFTSILTDAQYNTAAGLAAGTTQTTNLGRQFAWSGNGQSVYFNDTSATFGGIWATNVATGATTRIVTDTGTTRINTEPSVDRLNSTTDRIFFEGSSALGNIGGLNSVDWNGTTASAVQTQISPSTLNTFLNNSASNVFAITATAFDQNTGSLFFWGNNGASGDALRRDLLEEDANGNIWKVFTYQERADFSATIGVTTLNANVLRLQTRETTLNGAPITQILYEEPSSGNYVGSAYVYKPGDFDRDNHITFSDVAQFRQAITSPAAATSKFDLNGDNAFTFADIQLGLKAFDFGAGDITLSGVVDFSDYQILEQNVGKTGATFLQGDLNGDGVVDFADYQILEQSYGHISSILPPTFTPDLRPLPAFVGAVPEPASLSLLGVSLMALTARRRRSR